MATSVVEEIDALGIEKVDIKYDPYIGKVVCQFGEKKKLIDPFELRVKCMCAGCIDEVDGRQIL